MIIRDSSPGTPGVSGAPILLIMKVDRPVRRPVALTAAG
jgi:hypothetical protein